MSGVHRIVIVGGGAGGLELATKLGRRMGAEQVTLVDQQLFHIWKPSLHEVAAGTLDIHQEGLSYEMLAHDNGFTFCYGAMTGLELSSKQLHVGPVFDEHGHELVPARQLAFDQLVVAVGSTANHYNVAGAAEFTLSLNRTADAEHFRLRMLKLLTAADLRKSVGGEGLVRIVIIGGGATGVELAAELREASVVHSRYGFRRIDPHRDVQITLLEGADRILAPLPEKVSVAAAQLLKERHVSIEVNCKVARITPQQVEDATGRVFASDLGGVGRRHQGARRAGCAGPAHQPFRPTAGEQPAAGARSERHLCAGRLRRLPHGRWRTCSTARPGRAPAGRNLLAVLMQRAQGQLAPDLPYIYRDHGSLVSLGTQSSVGTLMGNLSNWFVQGLLARTMYVSLHLMHHQAVLAVARFLVKRATPLVKLH